MAKQVKSFETEVKQILDLMVNSLYSHREIFLRELISNSCDALDKLRFEELTSPEIAVADKHIRIRGDKEQKTLQIIDNPSGTRVSPMSHVHFVTLVSGSDTGGNGGEGVRLSPVRHSSWLFHIVNISTYFIGNISK